ncbi:autotransporter outer membrane beta-barrel domain-containing protein [Rhodopseudomonas sp.]|uniref:autotransporter outer membrane beta-barrel domain-containing protein n=1 Tax=Rhodopseudomonas sp. TaxID=1078 RepID=UPI0039E23AA3
MSIKYRGAILVAAIVLAGRPAWGQTFNQFVAFGDSTIDSGFYRSLSSPGGGAKFNALWSSAVANGAGKPTSSPGLVSSEALAAAFGLSAIPADQGGANYATAGAKNVTVNTAATGGFTAAVPTVTQIANYLASVGGQANPNALYLISSGGNDVSYAVGGTGSGPYPANPQAYLVSAANSLASAVSSLSAAGARYILVPDLAYSFGNAKVQQDRWLYSQTLWSGLSAAGVNFIPVDFNAMRLAVAAAPAAFGFQYTDTSNFACSQPSGVSNAWALLCSSNPAAPSHLVTPDADQTRLYADEQHLTTAGQKILADYEYSLIVAPSEISFLAEAPVKTRAVMVDSIFNQIALSRRNRTAGTFNVWIAGDVSSLKVGSGYDGFPNDPGTPAALTGGVDYAFDNGLLIGAVISGGRTTQSFDLGGNFRMDEVAGSIYAAYGVGPVWGKLVGSYGSLRYDVNRIVPIGITTQSNFGNTSGRNTSFAAEFGYDFTASAPGAQSPALAVKARPAPTGWLITHGPVAGVVLQRIDIDGFTETDAFAASGGFTALSFGSQARNSAVTELGYRASVDLGTWQPFAKLVWNHEFASLDRSVTASLTTVAAPGYAMPAVVLGRDWGAGTIGASVTIAQQVTGYAAFTSQIGERNIVTYGGQLGLNVALR